MKSIFAVIVVTLLVFSPAACKKKEKEIEAGLPSIGNIAPDFTSKDVNGKTVKLSDYRGSVVLIEFWATWCGPCRELTPVFNKLYEKYRDRGFVILALTTEENINTVRSYIKDNGVTYPVLFADMKTIRRYGIISIPVSFLIDREGKITEKHIGFSNDIMQKLSPEIEKLL